MHKAVKISMLAVLFVTLAALPSQAQEDETGRIVMETIKVHPDQMASFEAAMKAFLPVLAEHGYPNTFYAFTGDDMTYYIASPIESLADIDEQWAAWPAFMEKVGKETITPLMEAFTGTYEYSQQGVWRHRPDLSYSSDPPPYDADKDTFRFWGFLYVKPGMEKQAEEHFKRFVELYAEKEVAWAWETYVGELGTEMPVYAYGEVGSSRGAFWTAADELEKEVGEDSMKIWLEMVKTLRSVDSVNAEYRPDLSYIPTAEEVEAEE